MISVAVLALFWLVSIFINWDVFRERKSSPDWYKPTIIVITLLMHLIFSLIAFSVQTKQLLFDLLQNPSFTIWSLGLLVAEILVFIGAYIIVKRLEIVTKYLKLYRHIKPDFERRLEHFLFIVIGAILYVGGIAYCLQSINSL